MILSFPEDFQFGTSTAATQIETAFEHDWLGHRARDGHIFNRTTDHEKRQEEDAEIISSLAPNYRLNLMWSRLQRGPLEPLEPDAIEHYKQFLQNLRNKGTRIMLVLHHFANPLWFAQLGGWEKKDNVKLWIDYAEKVVNEFGDLVSSWNTFNEPNLYTSLGWIAAEFPPHKKNLWIARKVINHISDAHEHMYAFIKDKYPKTAVGISHNCTVFEAENFAGILPAKIFDYLFMVYAPSKFKSIDFFGMSYYARITFDPYPITFLETPEKIIKLNKPHDDMWEYYPQGIKQCIKRYWRKFKKPVVITENGICSNDDSLRVKAIKEYLKLIHEAIEEGVDVKGYYHWSTWDNFEWSLGPSYHFGLYACDRTTMKRTKKPSADVFTEIAFSNKLKIED